MRRALALLVLGAVLAALPACGKKEDFRDEVRRSLRATQVDSGLLVYNDERSDSSVTVKGIFDDDFLYKARVSYGRTDAYDEVVRDDTLAVRLLEPQALERIVDPARVATAKLDTEIEDVTSIQALQAKRWVVDVGAAPYLGVGQIDESRLGLDPVFDALTALDYVDDALTKSVEVERFDPDSLDPAYNESEDIFPEPEDGSGVTRYDLRRPDLPPPSSGALTGRAETSLPRTEHFRKMAIYIRDGKIFQVREAIEIRGKQLEDFAKYFRLMLKESKAPAEVRRDFDRAVSDAPAGERGEYMLTFLNEGLRQFGEPPILMRRMNLEFKNLGSDVEVDLPTEAVVKGELDFLNLSAAAKAPAVAAAPGAGGASGSAPPEGAPTGADSTTGGGDGTTGGAGAGDTTGAEAPAEVGTEPSG